jgi:hypothetical protein
VYKTELKTVTNPSRIFGVNSLALLIQKWNYPMSALPHVHKFVHTWIMSFMTKK